MRMKTTTMVRRIAVMILAAMLIAGSSVLAVAEEVPEDRFLFTESFEAAFTTYPSGWSANGGASRNTEHHSDGSASIMLRDNSTTASYYAQSPKIVLDRGVYYHISVDVYNITGNGSVFIKFYTVGGKETDSVSSTVTVTGKWTEVNFSVTLPENASYATVLLYSGLANKGETCYDRVRVYPEAGESAQQVYDFDLKIPSFPRLFAAGEELNGLREFAADPALCIAGYSGKECADRILSEANELLTKSYFTMTFYSSTTVNFAIPFAEKHFTSSPTGYSGSNFPYWQEMGNRMMEMMQTLAAAYLLTGEQVYASRAIELATSLAGWSTWTEYPTVNRTSLETGYFVSGVCTVYDLCYPCLTEEQKTILETAVAEKGLAPLYADLTAFTDHNYYVNKAAALATGSLLLLGKHPDAAKYLSRAYDFFAWYLDYRTVSESQEGLSYTSYSMDLLYGALDQIRRVTGDRTLLDHPYPNILFRWAIMSADNDNGFGPPISDRYSNTYFFTVANVMEGNDCAGIAKWYLSTRKFDDVTDFRKLIYRPRTDGTPVETPDAYFARTGINLLNGTVSGIGWGALRTGWGKNDMLLVCVSNNSSQGHSHYDQNSFVLSLGGEWICSDPGYQDYGTVAGSNYTLSYGHSTIYVDGQSQSVKGFGALSTRIDGAAFSYLLGSAAGAYRDPALSTFDRSYIMVNYGGVSYYVLADDLLSDAAHEYTWVMNADGLKSAKYRSDGGYDTLSAVGASFTGSEFFATGSDHAIRVAFDRAHFITYDTCEKQGGIIRVSSGDAAESGTFCAVISALGGKGVNAMNIEKSVSVERSYTNDGQIGVRTAHGELSDLILISRASGVLAEGLSADGSSASLFGLSSNGRFLGYSATDARSLEWNGKALLISDVPVSVCVFFDGSESVVTGPVGTPLKIFAPNGISGLVPDADGYCTLVLSSERTVLGVLPGSSDAPGTPGVTDASTDEPAPPAPHSGCRSSASPLALVFVAALPLPAFSKRKKNAKRS